ncbi:MAG: SCO family protein [Myxococcales bacterium]
MRTLSLLALVLTTSGAAFAGSPWGADYFPNVALVNQDGAVVHFYDDLIKGKAVAVNLIYTHCNGTCPLETAKMAQVQKLLGDKVGKEIFFYSISIDPERDTPERLKAYAERYHVGPGWQFLTGKPDDIKLVANKLGLASLTDAANRDGHQPSLMVGNEATGQWMRNSAIDNPQFLAATISNFFGWNRGKPVHDYAKLEVAPAVDKGAYLFQTRCAACHTIGKGDSLGPDLANVTKRRDPAWVDRFLKDPGKMIDGGDPIAKALFATYRGVRMPNLSLGAEEIAALLGHIEARSPVVRAARAD